MLNSIIACCVFSCCPPQTKDSVVILTFNVINHFPGVAIKPSLFSLQLEPNRPIIVLFKTPPGSCWYIF